jgi:hypothetical protein
MKRNYFSIIAVASMISLLYGGQDTILAPDKPIPVPKPEKEDGPSAKFEKEKISPPLVLYVGGGFTYSKADCECEEIETSDGTKKSTSEATTYGANLKAGYDFNKFIGVEAKYIVTPWGDEGKKLKHYGLYLKPNYNVIGGLDVYGLIGYGKTECKSQNIDENGFAWGLGAEYTIKKDKKDSSKSGLGIYVEYTKPLKKTGSQEIDTSVAGGGVSFHF